MCRLWAPPIVRGALRALKEEDHAVVSVATGCLEVSSCIYPYTSWKNCSFIHTAFANAAATLSGAQRTYESLKKSGNDDSVLKLNYSICGDGGTLDIDFNRYLEQWKEAMIWHIFAMTMVHI